VVPLPPEIGAKTGQLDKVVHVCEYLLLAWCLVHVASASGYARVSAAGSAFVFAVTYGLILEGVQALLPYRSAEWMDAVANAVGAGLGAWSGIRFSPVLRGNPTHR